jgi:3-hydroxyisobutyrate dehydrogenase
VDEALKGARVVCSCLTDGPALRSLLFSPGRDLKAFLAPDAIAVDFATIGPVEARGIATELAQRGVRFVDAPVTGGDIGAQNATLTIMVGGESEDVEAVRPLLNTMGKKVVHAGPIGAGQSLKLVNQLLCGVNLLAVVEAFQVAERTGVDRAQVVEACGGGAAGSWQLVNLGPKIISQDDRPGFRVAHLYKDLKFLRDELAVSGAKPPPYLEMAIAAFACIDERGEGDLGTQTAWKVHPVARS